MNPYLIIGLGALWVVSVGAAGWKGMDYQKGQDAIAQQEAVDKAITDHEKQSVDDMNAMYAWGKKNAAARSAAQTIRSQANDAFATNHLPVTCDWDLQSFGVLTAAIKAASVDAPASSGLSDAISAANSTSKQSR